MHKTRQINLLWGRLLRCAWWKTAFWKRANEEIWFKFVLCLLHHLLSCSTQGWKYGYCWNWVGGLQRGYFQNEDRKFLQGEFFSLIRKPAYNLKAISNIHCLLTFLLEKGGGVKKPPISRVCTKMIHALLVIFSAEWLSWFWFWVQSLTGFLTFLIRNSRLAENPLNFICTVSKTKDSRFTTYVSNHSVAMFCIISKLLSCSASKTTLSTYNNLSTVWSSTLSLQLSFT